MIEIDREEMARMIRRAAVPGSDADLVRVAALDVGSNSFHLVVVEADAHGGRRVLDRSKEMVRLGEGTLRDGVIAPGVFERGLAALRRLRDRAEALAPEAIVAVGTSALREAANGWEFVETARRELGLPIRVIDGLDEARLIYLGAREAVAPPQGNVALFDIGGGSTEAILGDAEACLLATSLRLGVLRLRDVWSMADPPTAGELAVVREWVRTLLESTVRRFKRAGYVRVALSSGTALALARVAGVEAPAAEGAHRYRLTLGAVATLEDRLARMTQSQRAALPHIGEGRADTIVGGAVVVRTILELCGVDEALVCDAALREGIVLDYVARRGRRAR